MTDRDAGPERLSEEELREIEQAAYDISKWAQPPGDSRKCKALAARYLQTFATRERSLRAENEKLRDALEEHGEHRPSCDWHDAYEASACTCGLSAALEGGSHNPESEMSPSELHRNGSI